MDLFKDRSSRLPSWQGRRPIAALLIAFGIYTFFITLVSLRSPVLGRTEWSAFNMTLEVRKGRLPADRHWIELPVLEDTLVYLMLMIALVMLLLPGGRKPLYHLSTVGLIISTLATRNATRHCASFVTGSSSIAWKGGAKFGPAMYLLPLTMLALFLVSRGRVTDEA
jgi:hypothetical protein